MRNFAIVVIALTCGCAGQSSQRVSTVPAAGSTAYYYGSVEFFSPDGKTPFGKTVSLIRREIKPLESKIVEAVIQPPRKPSDKPKEFIATMTRVSDTNEFLGTDSENSFTGKLVFEGKGWSLPRWSYDIYLKDGSRITGTGALDSEGIKTEKLFASAAGPPTVLMKENLRAISSSEYVKRRQEMLP